MRDGVLRIELDRTPIRTLRRLPAPCVALLDVRNDDVRRRGRGVERERTLGGSFGRREDVVWRREPHDADHDVRLGEPGPRERGIGIALDGPPEILDAPPEI